MIVIKIIVVVVGMALSIFLFRKAASTIDIGKINVISYIMYLFLAQTMIGASLVYLWQPQSLYHGVRAQPS